MIVAEGNDHRRRRAAAVGASMGPQHDSCGRAVVDCSGEKLAELQWGRNMIVAEGTHATVIDGVADHSFNGAAT